MAHMRKPFQGAFNIIRFNWHYYALSVALILLLLFIRNYLNESYQLFLNLITIVLFVSITLSLFISLYVYDLSNLYQLNWLDGTIGHGEYTIVNVNAGFDETSMLLQKKFGNADLKVFIFMILLSILKSLLKELEMHILLFQEHKI